MAPALVMTTPGSLSGHATLRGRAMSSIVRNNTLARRADGYANGTVLLVTGRSVAACCQVAEVIPRP